MTPYIEPNLLNQQDSFAPYRAAFNEQEKLQASFLSLDPEEYTNIYRATQKTHKEYIQAYEAAQILLNNKVNLNDTTHQKTLILGLVAQQPCHTWAEYAPEDRMIIGKLLSQMRRAEYNVLKMEADAADIRQNALDAIGVGTSLLSLNKPASLALSLGLYGTGKLNQYTVESRPESYGLTLEEGLHCLGDAHDPKIINELPSLKFKDPTANSALSGFFFNRCKEHYRVENELNNKTNLSAAFAENKISNPVLMEETHATEKNIVNFTQEEIDILFKDRYSIKNIEEILHLPLNKEALDHVAEQYAQHASVPEKNKQGLVEGIKHFYSECGNKIKQIERQIENSIVLQTILNGAVIINQCAIAMQKDNQETSKVKQKIAQTASQIEQWQKEYGFKVNMREIADLSQSAHSLVDLQGKSLNYFAQRAGKYISHTEKERFYQEFKKTLEENKSREEWYKAQSDLHIAAIEVLKEKQKYAIGKLNGLSYKVHNTHSHLLSSVSSFLPPSLSTLAGIGCGIYDQINSARNKRLEKKYDRYQTMAEKAQTNIIKYDDLYQQSLYNHHFYQNRINQQLSTMITNGEFLLSPSDFRDVLKTDIEKIENENKQTVADYTKSNQELQALRNRRGELENKKKRTIKENEELENNKIRDAEIVIANKNYDILCQEQDAALSQARQEHAKQLRLAPYKDWHYNALSIFQLPDPESEALTPEQKNAIELIVLFRKQYDDYLECKTTLTQPVQSILSQLSSIGQGMLGLSMQTIPEYIWEKGELIKNPDYAPWKNTGISLYNNAIKCGAVAGIVGDHGFKILSSTADIVHSVLLLGNYAKQNSSTINHRFDQCYTTIVSALKKLTEHFPQIKKPLEFMKNNWPATAAGASLIGLIIPGAIVPALTITALTISCIVTVKNLIAPFSPTLEAIKNLKLEQRQNFNKLFNLFNHFNIQLGKIEYKIDHVQDGIDELITSCNELHKKTNQLYNAIHLLPSRIEPIIEKALSANTIITHAARIDSKIHEVKELPLATYYDILVRSKNMHFGSAEEVINLLVNLKNRIENACDDSLNGRSLTAELQKEGKHYLDCFQNLVGYFSQVIHYPAASALPNIRIFYFIVHMISGLLEHYLAYLCTLDDAETQVRNFLDNNSLIDSLICIDEKSRALNGFIDHLNNKDACFLALMNQYLQVATELKFYSELAYQTALETEKPNSPKNIQDNLKKRYNLNIPPHVELIDYIPYKIDSQSYHIINRYYISKNLISNGDNSLLSYQQYSKAAVVGGNVQSKKIPINNKNSLSFSYPKLKLSIVGGYQTAYWPHECDRIHYPADKKMKAARIALVPAMIGGVAQKVPFGLLATLPLLAISAPALAIAKIKYGDDFYNDYTGDYEHRKCPRYFKNNRDKYVVGHIKDFPFVLTSAYHEVNFKNKISMLLKGMHAPWITKNEDCTGCHELLKILMKNYHFYMKDIIEKNETNFENINFKFNVMRELNINIPGFFGYENPLFHDIPIQNNEVCVFSLNDGQLIYPDESTYAIETVDNPQQNKTGDIVNKVKRDRAVFEPFLPIFLPNSLLSFLKNKPKIQDLYEKELFGIGKVGVYFKIVKIVGKNEPYFKLLLSYRFHHYAKTPEETAKGFPCIEVELAIIDKTTIRLFSDNLLVKVEKTHPCCGPVWENLEQKTSDFLAFDATRNLNELLFVLLYGTLSRCQHLGIPGEKTFYTSEGTLMPRTLPFVGLYQIFQKFPQYAFCFNAFYYNKETSNALYDAVHAKSSVLPVQIKMFFKENNRITLNPDFYQLYHDLNEKKQAIFTNLSATQQFKQLLSQLCTTYEALIATTCFITGQTYSLKAVQLEQLMGIMHPELLEKIALRDLDEFISRLGNIVSLKKDKDLSNIFDTKNPLITVLKDKIEQLHFWRETIESNRNDFHFSTIRSIIDDLKNFKYKPFRDDFQTKVDSSRDDFINQNIIKLEDSNNQASHFSFEHYTHTQPLYHLGHQFFLHEHHEATENSLTYLINKLMAFFDNEEQNESLKANRELNQWIQVGLARIADAILTERKKHVNQPYHNYSAYHEVICDQYNLEQTESIYKIFLFALIAKCHIDLFLNDFCQLYAYAMKCNVAVYHCQQRQLVLTFSIEKFNQDTQDLFLVYKGGSMLHILQPYQFQPSTTENNASDNTPQEKTLTLELSVTKTISSINRVVKNKNNKQVFGWRFSDTTYLTKQPTNLNVVAKRGLWTRQNDTSPKKNLTFFSGFSATVPQFSVINKPRIAQQLPPWCQTEAQFLEEIPQYYADAMRQPHAFWGGDVEINIIGMLREVAIFVVQNGQPYPTIPIGKRHLDDNVTPNPRQITIYFDGAHYSLANHTINSDGDCLFNACTQAIKKIDNPDYSLAQSTRQDIQDLRNAVAGYILANDSEQEAIRVRYQAVLVAETDEELRSANNDLFHAPYTSEVNGLRNQRLNVLGEPLVCRN